MDIGGASLGLVLTAPLMGATALAIRTTMGSPILFRQERPGLHGIPFELVKFRTMTNAGAGSGPDGDAARLNALGGMLRKLSIDELPTLWNVLIGEMSLVGPRPLMMQYLERYTEDQARRHNLPPGVTGWAQVNGRNANSWPRKFELDTWYIDHWSLLLDVRILWMTIFKVLARSGVSADGHISMPEYMGMHSSSTLEPQ